ncbi:sulfotransferase [Sulfuriferula multivorans]|uniref:sulfotransferase n=1 Tax=Sulfuriferula multivorans TaxID=1559896 RepID=UPI000F5B9361|nr:sulfotransferase [Sulfuriferula multivorans]
MMNNYIIIGPARSGTTVTHLILKGHPQVSALNDEVQVMKLFGDGISTYTSGNDSQIESINGFRHAYEMLALLNLGKDTRAAGIKCAVISIEAARVFAERIKASFPDVSIIVIVREDILAQYASLTRARKTNIYHSWKIKTDSKTLKKINIDKGSYSRYFLENIEIINILRSLRETNKYLEISYEQDILPSLDYCSKLYEFLELDYVEPTWVNSKKVAPLPKEFVSNYENIKAIEPALLENIKELFSFRYYFKCYLKRFIK